MEFSHMQWVSSKITAYEKEKKKSALKKEDLSERALETVVFHGLYLFFFL